jgi:hypothetical protein
VCGVVATTLFVTSVGSAEPVAPQASAPSAPPALIATVLSASTIDASGQGSVSVHVHLATPDGHVFTSGTAVRAVILRGDARLADGLSADLRTDDTSDATLLVSPGTRTGPLVIRFDIGDASVDVPLALTADVRAPFVVGYATGGIGPVPGWIEAADNAPDGNDTRRGAVSIFGTGKIARNTRGTFAYDSSDTLQQSLQADPFLDNPNDRPFPIYGDSSIRHDDALSTNHLFASVQNGYSSAMWGEFYAKAAPSTAVGGYDILVNGARVIAGTDRAAVSVFTASNHIAYARAIISPTGLAIASQALEPDIVIGSDVLTLVHLDRRTGAVLAQTTLVRGSDYVIDYASGLLRFLNIILPYDDAFNPQIIQVQYEYGGPNAKSTMLGADGSAKLTPNTRVDAWYLNDAIGSGNLVLLGQSLAGSSPNTLWSFSHERSTGFLPITPVAYGDSGDAFHGSFTAHASNVKVTVGFASADAAYDNPYGSYTQPGLMSLNAVIAFSLSHITELDLSYLDARNQLPATASSEAVANSDQQGAITLRVKPSPRLSYHVGVENDGATSNGVVNPVLFAAGGSPSTATPGSLDGFLPAFDTANQTAGSGHSLDVNVGGTWRFTPRASVSVSRLQPLGLSSDPYDPPQTQAELDWDVTATGKAFLRQLWQQSSSPSLAATQAGQTSTSTAQSETSFGFEQQVGPATYQTGYAVEHTASGTDLFDAIGVRTKLIASKRFNADGFLQIGNSLYASEGSSTSPFFVAFGSSLDYATTTFHANAQAQVRTGFDAGSTYQFASTGAISPAVSLFGSYTGSYTASVVDTEGRFGLAYRPSRNDRYVTLASLDIYRSNISNYDAYITNVAQIQELYRSSSRTEWAASAAYKLTGDSFFAPDTTIFGVRVDQKIGGRFDLGSEAHWSNTAPISGTSATGFAVEAGERIGSTLRLAAGYNFQGFADPETAVNPTHRGLYVTMSTYIDRIFGWGKDDR